MRRVAALVLIALGTALLALAVLLRTFVAPQVVTAPLDQYSQTVAVAEDATYLSVKDLRLEEGRTMVATRTVRGDVAAGNDERAVYDVFVKIMDPDKPGEGEDQLVSATTDRVAFDRRTSEAINCCDENVDGDAVEHEGIEYKFPFGVEKRTYQYFDTSIRAATDMEFVEETELEGLTVYKFQQIIAPTRIAELDIPGSLVDEETTVRLGRFYSNVRTVYVEPTTGMILKGEENQFSTLRDSTGRDRLVITEADLVFTDETVKEQADIARDNISDSRLVTTTGPLVSLLLGLLLAGLGIFLLLRPTSTGGRRVADDRQPEYV